MKIVAVTSCATGIAHSYMSAEALKKTAKKKGFQIKVEIQGALGIENRLTSSDIQEADLIIFANDVGVSEFERFSKVKEKIFQSAPHDVIKDTELVFEKAIKAVVKA